MPNSKDIEFCWRCNEEFCAQCSNAKDHHAYCSEECEQQYEIEQDTISKG